MYVKQNTVQYPSIQYVGLLDDALVRDGTRIDCIYLLECNTSCRVVFVLFICLFVYRFVGGSLVFLSLIYLFYFCPVLGI